MPWQLEVTLAHACDALRTGQYPSFRAAAKAYSLTELTLRRRYQNLTSTRTDAATSKRSITPWQEELLVTWIINMEQSGHPVSQSQLREFVSLLNVSSGGQDCGHNWTQRFLKRRPELRAKMGTKIDTLRLKNTTPEKLRPWFDALQALIRRIGVKPLNIWIVDVRGIALGVCNSYTVFGTTATTKSYTDAQE